MCTTCGCSDTARGLITNLKSGRKSLIAPHTHDHVHPHDHAHGDRSHAHDHDHDHTHDHTHEHTGEHTQGRVVTLEAEILAKNNTLAERNRGWFEGRNILALNLVSSPGSGKTSLLVKTIKDLSTDIKISVIEGDQETINDARRIRETGCEVIQINTGTGCHLEADMLAGALKELQPPSDSVLMIENVGNLVCPALFDLGEKCKVAILSVTEGEDKPIKYPHMFRASDVLLINKIDLLPYVDFDVDACIEYARHVNPDVTIFEVSATTGEGMPAWYDWLKQQINHSTDVSASQ